ncbi:MAG: SDR family oxidoreductase [Campylobacterota bacterium]|nr:SDR family oxidoreductase [Campylobacterota bacterium]
MKHVLVVGATGYLGRYIVRELHDRGYLTTLVVRDKRKLESSVLTKSKIVEGDLRDENLYRSVMDEVDVVISTIGITRQKDSLTYMDVDYGVNHLLLCEALRAGVEKFIYVSVLHGEKLKHLKICEAKERFVEELQATVIDSTTIRPSGFYSDMEEYLVVAKHNRIYLLGDGEKRANPIDGSDLAKVCVNAIDVAKKEIEVGGPEVYTYNEMAGIAFRAVNKNVKISYVPLWLARAVLSLLKVFTSQKTYGPLEFFLSVVSMDMVASKYGTKLLAKHFEEKIDAKK